MQEDSGLVFGITFVGGYVLINQSVFSVIDVESNTIRTLHNELINSTFLGNNRALPLYRELFFLGEFVIGKCLIEVIVDGIDNGFPNPISEITSVIVLSFDTSQFIELRPA